VSGRRSKLLATLLLAGALGLALSLIDPAPARAQAQAAKPDTLTETYGNWTVSCQTVTADGKSTRRCQLSQELKEKGGQGQRVLGLIIASPEPTAELTVITPLGIALSAGLTIEVGDAPLLKMAFSTCRPGGCFAAGPLTAKALTSLETAEEATARLGTLKGQPLLIKFPLPGLAQARKRLAELVKG